MKTPAWALMLMAAAGLATVASVRAFGAGKPGAGNQDDRERDEALERLRSASRRVAREQAGLPPVDFTKAAAEMAAAADAFLASLKPDQLARAKFDLKSDERLNWHFIPRDPEKERKGLTLKLMTPEQKKLALALLATGLSAKGYEKATTIMTLESILAEMEGPNRRFPRDPELYHFLVFGKPDPKGSWAWRAEGHHLSLSFTIAEGRAIAGAPAFFGTNPALVKDGPRKGLRVLGDDEELGRSLAKSLTAEQKEGVIDAKAPADVLLMPGKKVEPLSPAGIAASKLSAPQMDNLKKLVQEYARRCRAELADQDLARIEAAGWDKLAFAWAGGLEPGQGHYYRVQGPTFILEYDNTQNNANHVHSLWHDPADDFGAGILKKHLQESHNR